MPWNLDSDRPIFMQILERIRVDIISGRYQPGDKLPSVRELAAEAAVNPNTMQRAFAELERTGLVHSKRTSGRFITEDREMIETLKVDIAKEKIQLFLDSMEQLGYDKEQILALMSQTLDGKGSSNEYFTRMRQADKEIWKKGGIKADRPAAGERPYHWIFRAERIGKDDDD